MKRALTAVSLIALAAACAAQSTGPGANRAELPPGPLLNRAPDSAEWEVSYHASGIPNAGGAAVPLEPSTDDSRSYKATIAKSKDVYHVEVAKGGEKIDKWCIGSAQVTTSPNAQLPIVSLKGNDQGDPFYVDFSKADFPGLQWISKNNFAGVTNNGSADILLFRDELPDATGEKVPAIAAIDMKTRWPLYMRVGEAVTLFENIRASSVQVLPPPDVAARVNAGQERLRKASLVPPP